MVIYSHISPNGHKDNSIYNQIPIKGQLWGKGRDCFDLLEMVSSCPSIFIFVYMQLFLLLLLKWPLSPNFYIFQVIYMYVYRQLFYYCSFWTDCWIPTCSFYSSPYNIMQIIDIFVYIKLFHLLLLLKWPLNPNFSFYSSLHNIKYSHFMFTLVNVYNILYKLR
jgi:hypothetical protein